MEKEKPPTSWGKTRFTKKIRIKPETLKLIQENRQTKSAAGFLDIIVNQYFKQKQNGEILK